MDSPLQILQRSILVPPTPSIHASNILKCGDQYLVVWFGGTREKHPDTAIYSAFYNPNGRGKTDDDNWGKVRCIANIDPNIAHWNPILFNAGDRIICYFKTGRDCEWWRTWEMYSTDGVNWSRPTLLMPGDMHGRGATKTKPLILSDGSWLSPGSNEHNHWTCLFDRSTDGGKTWVASDPVMHPITGVIQPAMWESEPGHIHALMRSDVGNLYRTNSSDYGVTWSRPRKTDLANNNSGIDIVKYGKKLVMVYNPVPINWGPRTPLVVCVSSNNGLSWQNETAIAAGLGEFSYPSLIIDGNKFIATFTVYRRRIGLVSGRLH